MANNKDNSPWYNWVNPVYGAKKGWDAYENTDYYKNASTGTGIAGRVGGVAGELAGYDVLNTIEDTKNLWHNPGDPWNLVDLGMSGSQTLFDAGAIASGGGALLYKGAAKDAAKRAFMKGPTGFLPDYVRAAERNLQRKVLPVFKKDWAVKLPEVGKAVSNVALFGLPKVIGTAKEAILGSPKVAPKVTYSNVTSNAPVSVDPNELWKNSGPGSKAFWASYVKNNPKGAMAAKKEDWKNDDTSYANFEAAFKEQNPSLWLSKQAMETKSPLADAYEKKALTESEESFNRAMAQIEASDKAINKNFGVDKTAQYGATEGDKQSLAANLSAMGMRRSVGQMGVGLEDISNVGANAQASLLAARQAKLLANRGTASELDIKRKEDRNTILQNANNQRLVDRALTLGIDPAIFNSIIQGGY